jgi:hypothetical protein
VVFLPPAAESERLGPFGFRQSYFSLSMICLNFRCRCFTDRADILSAGGFENALRPINVFVFIDVHGDQVVSLFNFSS